MHLFFDCLEIFISILNCSENNLTYLKIDTKRLKSKKKNKTEKHLHFIYAYATIRQVTNLPNCSLLSLLTPIMIKNIC